MGEKKEPVLIFTNKLGEELYRCGITSISISETIIKEKSNEFFCDPEPCFIHKNAVLARLYVEINEWVSGLRQQDEISIPVSEIPESIKNYLSFQMPQNTAVIIIKK